MRSRAARTSLPTQRSSSRGLVGGIGLAWPWILLPRLCPSTHPRPSSDLAMCIGGFGPPVPSAVRCTVFASDRASSRGEARRRQRPWRSRRKDQFDSRGLRVASMMLRAVRSWLGATHTCSDPRRRTTLARASVLPPERRPEHCVSTRQSGRSPLAFRSHGADALIRFRSFTVDCLSPAPVALAGLAAIEFPPPPADHPRILPLAVVPNEYPLQRRRHRSPLRPGSGQAPARHVHRHHAPEPPGAGSHRQLGRRGAGRPRAHASR